MIIDLRTLAFVAGIANFLQVAAIYTQYRVNKKTPGVGLWLAGFSMIACGFILFILRDFISIKLFSTILPNALQISGIIFLYAGVVRFLGGREPSGLIVAFLIVFFLCFFYYTYGQDDINIRTMLVSAGFAFFSFLIAYSLFMNRYAAIAVSANFNAMLMSIYGFVALLRAVETQMNPQTINLFDPSFIQIIFFLASFVEGLLFAFGLVAMINQLSNAEAIEAKNQFEIIFNTSPDAVLITRLHDGYFAGINEGFLKLTGYTREELNGKSTLGVDIWSNPADRRKIVNDIQEKGFCENLEGVFKTKDGSQRIGLISAKLTNLHGQPHIISVTRDITERKQADDALRKSKEQYDRLASRVPVGFYSVHSGKNGLFAFDYVSPRMAEMIDVSVEDLLADPASALSRIHSDDYGLFTKLNQGADEQLSSFEWNGRVLVRGETRWMQIVSSPELLGNGDLLWHGFVLDITDRVRAEEEIHKLNVELERRVEERTHELREAQEQLIRHEKLAVLGQMAGSIGHELRNPLAVITGALYYLKLVQANADEKIKQYLGIIEQEVKTSEQIISDLLDFARVKSVDREVVPVSDLIHQTLERFPVPPSVRVVVDIPDDLPRVYVDKRQMIQVLGNLTTNACQAMTAAVMDMNGVQNDGQLSLYSNIQNDMINITVKDTGAGITPENMMKIFEPLFTTKARGIGLGLAVSQKLVDANGGRIEVKSEPGKGSSFSVYLPIYEESL